MAASRKPRWVVGSALVMTVLSASVGCMVGGAEAAASAFIGACVGTAVQGAAFFCLMRKRDAGMVDFLEAFLRATTMRLIGGAVLVWFVLTVGAAEAPAFLAGFGAAYVALEVAADIEFVRRSENEGRSGPTG